MQSMDEIYQEYARMVYKYLLSRTHREDLAEELTQETFYQALRSIDRFDESCRISTWLCAIAKNQHRMYCRKHPLSEENLKSELIVLREVAICPCIIKNFCSKVPLKIP